MQLCNILFEQNSEDYRGQHSAPDSTDSPLWNVVGAYPEDIYGPNGIKYYTGEEIGELVAITIVRQLRNKPNASIKIYRAVPYEPTFEEQILQIENHKAFILRTGRIPKTITTTLSANEYYKYLNDKKEELQNKLSTNQIGGFKPNKINSGDWVTIVRQYAVVHGTSALNGKYRVLSKTVKAKNLYTDGNDIREWGYVK